MSKTYKEAGVDIQKGDLFVERIKKLVGSTYTKEVTAGVGGFSSLYDQGDRYLVAGTDGVGTKIKIAQQLGIHSSVGIDLVAMCVNDIICCGARPLFFLDYMAVGGLELEISEALIEGIVEGCKQAGCALIGGETAEMPALYKQGEYDLAGFSVGEVFKADLIDGSRLEVGDQIIGIASSGFHSNGYSLLRKWAADDSDLLRDLLTPTKIYVKCLNELKKLVSLKGLAHITGGGIHNIARINKNFDYQIDQFPALSDVEPIFEKVFSRFELTQSERFETFNMGIGLCVVVAKDQVQKSLDFLHELGEKAFVIGQVQNGSGKVHLSC